MVFADGVMIAVVDMCDEGSHGAVQIVCSERSQDLGALGVIYQCLTTRNGLQGVRLGKALDNGALRGLDTDQ